MFRTLLILGRVSNLPTVWTNTIVGWFLAGGDWSWQLLWLVIGISLIYIAGMTLNDAFDAEWDAENAPERPIPAGKISRKFVWAVGLIEMLLGARIAFSGQLGNADEMLVFSLVGAIFLYDWLHKKWAGSVVIMGVCRGLVYFAAASAALASSPESSLLESSAWPIWMMAVGMILYIAGITLTARGERSKGAGEPILARIFINAPLGIIILSGSMIENGSLRVLLFFLTLIAFVGWLGFARVKIREGKIGPAVGWMLAGIIVIDAIPMAYIDWRMSLLFLLVLLPLTLAAQRKIPAT